MASTLLKDVRDTLFEFNNEFLSDFEKVMAEFLAERNLLVKEAAELKKVMTNTRKRGRPKVIRNELESLPEVDEEKMDDGTSGRPRRKAAQKARVFTKNINRTTRGTKRRNSTSFCSVEKSNNKSQQKEKLDIDEEQKKLITDCSVVVEKLNLHQSKKVEELLIKSKTDGNTVVTNTMKEADHVSILESEKTELRKSLRKSRENGDPLEKSDSISLKPDKLSNSKKRPFPDESPEGSDVSPINPPSSVPEKKSKISIFSSTKIDSDIKNSPPETKSEEILVMKEFSTPKFSKANQTKECSNINNRSAKEENDIQMTLEKDFPEKLKSKIPKPKENAAVFLSSTKEKDNEICSVKAPQESRPNTASSDEATESSGEREKYNEISPLKSHESRPNTASSEEVTKSSTRERDNEINSGKAGKGSRPNTASSEEVIDSSPEKNYRENIIVKATPEKRITRSKITKPKENKEIINDSPEDVINVTKASEEKRLTRSKAAKPKENKMKIRSPVESQEDQTSDEAVSEKRVTRSKVTNKPKENKKIKISPATDSDEEDSPEPAQSKNFYPQKLLPVKIKVTAKELLSPAVTAKEHLLEKENNFNRNLKTAEKKHSKQTPLQIRNGFNLTPVNKSKFLTSNAPTVMSASKSKSALDDAERRRKEEEALRQRLKTDEALRKKQEMMKAKQEDIRRKNEEKMLKVAAVRKAVNKETSERLVKMEKEKEERERLLREQLEKKKEEEMAKKKILHETKALEAETRRLKEEAARQARIKEMEEEKRKEEELRLKQQEETEKIRKQREEMRLKEAALLKAREIQKKKANVIPLKDKDNYDINDVQPGDDDSDVEDSHQPKKDIPMWARRSEEKDKNEKIQSFVSMDVVARFFSCPSQTPDLKEFFGKMTMKRVRTSSAVWLDSPPLASR